LNEKGLADETHSLVRELGLTEGIAIGLGTMVGAGIFVLSALAAERAGPASTVSYLIAGGVCLLVALVISELATGMPKAGGSYTFIAEALGPLAGSIVGPGNWLGLTFAGGFYLLAAGEYLGMVLPVPPRAASTVVGILFTWMNYRGAKLTGSVQNVVVVILLVILIAFIAVGLFNVDVQLYQPFAPRGWGAVVGTVGLIIVSFTGFEKVSTISEEMKRPGRNLPLAIVGSVVIATVLYGLILATLTGIFPMAGIAQREAPLVEAAGQVAGGPGSAVMLAAGILATLSSANAAIMASSRINYGMGRDGVLPDWFSHIHPKLNTPSNSILVTGGMAMLLSLTGQAEALAEISSALFMVSYALLCLSLMVMRSSRPSWYRPAFRAPLYPVLPVVAGLLCLAVIFTMAPSSRIAGLALVAGSLAWYVFWVRRKAKVVGEFGPHWERERPLEGVIEAAEEAGRPEKHEILLPFFPDSQMEPLMKLAAAMTRADEHRVIVALDVVVVPSQTPLESVEAGWDRQGGVGPDGELGTVARQGAELGVPVRTLRRAAHGHASGVLGVAEGRSRTELILLDWRGPLSPGRIYGSPRKTILQEARCHVAVLRERNLGEVRRVLIPASGGPHARLGLRLASEMAGGDGAEITVLRIARPGEDLNREAEERACGHLAQEVLGSCDFPVRTKVMVHEAIVPAILQEAREGNYDLLVIGASNEWGVKSLLVGAVPDAIADQAPCSVLMVRRYEPTGVSTIRRVMRSLQGW